MMRLTREVRFTLHNDPDITHQTHNGFGGIPAAQGWAHFYIIRVTLEGNPDPASSYIENISTIDQAVRQIVVPVFQSCIALSPRPPLTVVMSRSTMHLRDYWPDKKLIALELFTTPYQSITCKPSELPMIRLSQKFEFSAAHRLHNPSLDAQTNITLFGKCNNAHGHGHNYELQVTLIGEPDDSGQLIPTPRFESLVNQHAIALLDHKFLNVEVAAFRDLIPSVENIAKVVFSMLKKPLTTNRVKLASVIVWETPKTFAEYAEDE